MREGLFDAAARRDRRFVVPASHARMHVDAVVHSGNPGESDGLVGLMITCRTRRGNGGGQGVLPLSAAGVLFHFVLLGFSMERTEVIRYAHSGTQSEVIRFGVSNVHPTNKAVKRKNKNWG